MSNCSKLFFFLCCLPFGLLGQATTSLDWIKDLAREVQEETDLCERCTWVPPAISEVEFNNQIFYFLRFGCSTSESVARMYTPEGIYLGECKSNDDDFICNPPDVDAFITYTFASKITILWSCETGFDCAFAVANDIEREVPIFVDDDRCAEGIKTLQVSDKFVNYQWEGGDTKGTSAKLEVTKGGIYSITVTDEADCTFFGNIAIPDINKVNVKIKGPTQICPSTTAELLVFGFESYQWSTGATDSTITVIEPGDYHVTVTNSQNCEGTSSFSLQNYEPLDIAISANKTTLTEGNPVEVTVETPNESQLVREYNWTSNGQIDCSTCQEITYFPQINNELTVAVKDNNGCTNLADFFIEVEALPAEIYAPNIFKPTSSLGNNHFTLYGGTNIKIIEALSIFDRWGNLVFVKKNFSPNHSNLGWNGQVNGTEAKQDIYMFQAIIQFVNEEREIITGDLFLLR